MEDISIRRVQHLVFVGCRFQIAPLLQLHSIQPFEQLQDDIDLLNRNGHIELAPAAVGHRCPQVVGLRNDPRTRKVSI